MTYITRELNNPHSPLSQWFESKMSAAGHRLIKNHNEQMDRANIIKPLGEIQDFALIGTAFVYAFRWHLGLLHQRFDQTVASYNLPDEIFYQLIKAKTNEEKAIACSIFAAYEQQYRSGSLNEIATVLMNNDDRNKLKPDLHYVSVMVEDLANLIDSISSVWHINSDSLARCECFLNPTFAGSNYISGDGQQIVDKMLIKCFTTLKKYPMTQQHFWQQIAYVLMDWDDRYQLDKICWYYPRQKALFIYPIESLFKNLEKSRGEFKAFLKSNYDGSYDRDDYFSYLSYPCFDDILTI